MRKNIVIIGGKTQSRSLAEILLNKKHRVTVISPDESLCSRLREIDGLNVIMGDGRDCEVLQDADINQFDIAITMHDHDADNLVTCELCKKVYGVAKTISLVSDVKRKILFDAVGVDTVISATNLIAQTLEQQTLTDLGKQFVQDKSIEKDRNGGSYWFRVYSSALIQMLIDAKKAGK